MNTDIFKELLGITPQSGWNIDSIVSHCQAQKRTNIADQLLLLSDGSSKSLVKRFMEHLNRMCIDEVSNLSDEDAPKSVTHTIQLLLESRYRWMDAHPESFEALYEYLWKVENIPLCKDILHKCADDFWFYCGDRSTNMNYYSKRLLLASVLGTTTVAWYRGCRGAEALSMEIGTNLKRVLTIGRIKSGIVGAVSPQISALKEFVGNFLKK